jgi:hypothetical protein
VAIITTIAFQSPSLPRKYGSKEKERQYEIREEESEGCYAGCYPERSGLLNSNNSQKSVEVAVTVERKHWQHIDQGYIEED